MLKSTQDVRKSCAIEDPDAAYNQLEEYLLMTGSSVTEERKVTEFCGSASNAEEREEEEVVEWVSVVRIV